MELMVVWWDGFNREHQAVDPDTRKDLFDEADAEKQVKRVIKKGAVRAQIWQPGKDPTLIAEYRRNDNGSARKTYSLSS